LVLGALLLTCAVTAPAAPAPSTEPAARKLRTGSALAAAQLQQQGARLLADYGSFQFLAAPADRAVALAAAVGADVVDEQDVIELHSGFLRTTEPAVRALREPLPPFAGRRLHLVQFVGPIKQEWQAELLATGVELVAYLPHNAYLIYGDAPTLGRVLAWAGLSPAVQWEGAFLDRYRLHPTALPAKDADASPEAVFVLQLVADPVANPATRSVLAAWQRAPLLKEEAVLNYLNLTVRLPTAALPVLAAQPDVVSIWPYEAPRKQDERQGQILAGNLSGIEPSGPGYLAWLAAKGFTQAQFAASGFLVDVSDSGVDNATTTPGHFGLYPEGNTNLPSRVAYNRLLGTPHTGTLEGCDGHGTLDAHIVGGYNAFVGFPFTDAAGFSYGLGIAPFVGLGSSVIFDPGTFTNPNFTELQSRAYADGARISSNSWGQNNGGGYNTDAQIYDALTRDAQPAEAVFPAPGNQEMVIVFSAGNAGPTPGTVGAPGSAKNVLCVGAAENVHSFSLANGGNRSAGTDGCSRGDTAADSAEDMSDYSSRGPCADGRKKPDLVAPGTHITGGVAQQPAPGPLGTAIACFDARGICALTGKGSVSNENNFFPQGQQFYSTSTGTSHAAPAVAGGAALLRQYFLNYGQPPPSPAMTKAWLMNSARYLSGAYAGDTLPSMVQGHGSLDLGMAFDAVPRGVLDQASADKFTASGQTRTYTGTVQDPTRPFRVTLAWTDAPGSTAGGAFNNNLDLTVVVAGATYRGNVFSGPHSTSGGLPDTRNNVESVFLPPGTSGGFVITVTAANIVADGVPNEAPTLDQDFALVLYNVELQDAPVMLNDGLLLAAESCAPGNGAADPGEVVTLLFSLRNAGTAPTTNLMATLVSGGAVLNPGEPQDYGTLAIGAAATRAFSFQAVGECGATLPCRLRLTDGGVDRGTVSFPLRLGGTGSHSSGFSQPQQINIPSQGVAAPYPSVINVAGVPGTLTRVQATVHGFDHIFPSDVDLLLVSPASQSVLLLSRVGSGITISGITLTFDDAAGSSLSTPIVSGTFRPTANGSITLPAPAPAPPYGSTLSTLNGISPNGNWKLFVYDHSSGDSGVITAGWSLTLVTEIGVCCFNSTHANLALSGAVTPNPGAWESEVTYTLTVQNLGPAMATNVVLTNWLAPEVTFLDAAPSQGAAQHDAGLVVAALGALAPGASATVNLTATVNSGASLTNRVLVATDTFDQDPANNTLAIVSAALPPVLTIASHIAVVAENCGTGNGAADPGEEVTVALVLQNVGTRKTTNVVAALTAGGGVVAPSAAQTYGALLPGGPPATNFFSFTADGVCGGTLLAAVELTDLALPLATLTNRLRLGASVLPLAADFDAVTLPDLPAGWSTTVSGPAPGWSTTNIFADTPPNAAFAPSLTGITEQLLISPAFTSSTPDTEVTFRHRFDTESCCDGGRLDVSINDGVFTDIVAVGGMFIEGGYGFHDMWSGDSGGFITTTARLPAAALGQSVRLRWRFTADDTTTAVGWYVDSIAVVDGTTCCVRDDLSLSGGAAPANVMVGDEVAFTILVTNSGPAPAHGVVLTNYLPAASFVSATMSQGEWSHTNGVVRAAVGNLAAGDSATLGVVVRTTAVGTLTNLTVAARDGLEAYLENNRLWLTAEAAPRTVDLDFAAPAFMDLSAFGAAVPYPSTLEVTGVPGPITKVTATLHGLTHGFPDDLDFLLVGPTGARTLLMSDCGGGNPLSEVTLTFDDAAAIALPNTGAIVAGTFRPTDFALGDTFAAPAPAGPYEARLDVFEQTNANGLWQLLATDDSWGYAGTLSGGWSLRITVRDIPQPVLAASLGTGGVIELRFDSELGLNYVLEYKDSLDAPEWFSQAPVVGTGATLTLFDYPGGGTQRVYRLRVE
jgi:uncharacterized repeat protein (TIGR01451 family)